MTRSIHTRHHVASRQAITRSVAQFTLAFGLALSIWLRRAG